MCGIFQIPTSFFLSLCRPTDYPCVVGHEIVGEVTRVGNKVTKFKVGDRAGVGAQSYACLECGNCKDGFENLCERSFVSSVQNNRLHVEWTFPLSTCTLDDRLALTTPNGLVGIRLLVAMQTNGVATNTLYSRSPNQWPMKSLPPSFVRV